MQDVTNVLDFDQARGWEAVERKQSELQSARQRQLLQVVIDHVKAEVGRSLDGLMATLVADPQYHFWSGGLDHGPKGYDDVRRFYEQFVLSGDAVFESVKDRVIVEDNMVAHEGPVRNLVPGDRARARGYSVPDESGHYLVRYRNSVWWSFDEAGLALGEDAYTVMHPDDWERVSDHDLPVCYLEYLAEIGRG